jgi:sulfur transfer protein SufE
MPTPTEKLQTAHTAALEQAEKATRAEMTKIEEKHKRNSQFVELSNALARLTEEVKGTRRELNEAVGRELEKLKEENERGEDRE